MIRLSLLKFKSHFYFLLQILLIALILPKLAFSQTKKADSIIWVKSTSNIVDDLKKTEVGEGSKLFVLHNGQNDPLLDSINRLRSHYDLIFHNYGGNDEVNNLERFREIMQVEKMNILINSKNPNLAIEYSKEYPNRINLIVLRGETNPQIDLESKNKSVPITKEQLVTSAEYGKIEEVKFLLKSGIDPNFGIGEQSTSPLIAATIMGHLSVVKLLVKSGANVNGKYSDHYIATPIWYAANNGDFEIVKYLLDNGADPTVEDRNGWTPLRQAKLHNHTKVIELLESAIKNQN